MEYTITKIIDMEGLTAYLIDVKNAVTVMFTMTSSQIHKISDVNSNESVVLPNVDLYNKDEYLSAIYDKFFELFSKYMVVEENIDKIFRDLVIEFKWLWYEDIEKPISKRIRGGK